MCVYACSGMCVCNMSFTPPLSLLTKWFKKHTKQYFYFSFFENLKMQNALFEFQGLGLGRRFITHTKIETLRLTSREGNGPECSEVLTGFF